MEIWKDIPGYEKRYQASNLGNVRSLIAFRMPNVVMRQMDHYRGYKIIFLWNDKKEKRKYFVHRLVAMAFLPNEGGLDIVNHRDGNKKNNALWNLEWMSFSDNTKHWHREIKTASNIPF